MSDTTTLVAELPKFKDKVMYISNNADTDFRAVSYTISSSFQGIVRLSPNNHTIYDEKPGLQLSIQDEKSQGLSYSDAIVFDNNALSSKKSNCDITRRMIIASESTGYLVNFRISNKDVEFDNLGIIGMIQTDNLVLYSTNKLYNNNTFMINGNRMPTSAKTPSPSIERLYTNQEMSATIPIGAYDERKVSVTGVGDKSSLLYSTLDGDGSRIQKYKKTQLFIRDAVMQALLSLETIPTGSIHFVPVTIEQYKELCRAGNKPNQNYKNNKPSANTCDPIIRDFLLCDGRKYNNVDFPELAKILWKEHVTTWGTVKGSKGNTFVYPNKNISNSTEESDKYKFRVPDLRHMFIGAVPAIGDDNLKNTYPASHRNQSLVKTGFYFPDNIPVYTQKYKPDTHRHFIAYGTYDLSLFSSNSSFHTNFVNNYIKECSHEGNKSKLTIRNANNDYVGTMYLTNHPFWMGGYRKGDTAGEQCFNGFGIRPTSLPERFHVGVESIGAYFFASIPMKGELSKEYQQPAYDTSSANMTGKSSIQILSTYQKEPSGEFPVPSLHGHENAPKFFAMLPLIKI